MAGSSGDEDTEVIDYTIKMAARAVERTQVKSSRDPSSDHPVGLAGATEIITRMGPAAPNSGPPRILTNRPLSQQLREHCGAPTSTTAHTSTYEMTTADGLHGLITHDNRSVAEVKEALLQRIQQVRADRALGPGLRSAGLLMPKLVDRIADAAAGMSSNTISGTGPRPTRLGAGLCRSPHPRISPHPPLSSRGPEWARSSTCEHVPSVDRALSRRPGSAKYSATSPSTTRTPPSYAKRGWCSCRPVKTTFAQPNY